jgi:hypothetical protein
VYVNGDKTVKSKSKFNDEYLNIIKTMGNRQREDRRKRILEWATVAGPPHAEVLLRDSPSHFGRIGFWRVPGGLIRIMSHKNGEFDPSERIEITDREIKAIISASKHSVIEEE